MSNSTIIRGRGLCIFFIIWALFFFASAAQAASAWFNVKDYGAVGNGTTNDVAAINAALAAIPARGGVLYFPTGEYAINSPISLPNKNLSIRGDGMGTSVLKWTSVSGGFTYAPTLQDRELAFADIALTTTAMGGGTAVNAQWPDVIGAVHKTINMNNVEVRGSDFSRFWSIGVSLSGARYGKIDNLTVLGQNSSPSAMGVGLRIVSSGGACEIFINNPVITFAGTAIQISGGSSGAGNGPEGIYISQGALVNVGVGIQGATTTGEPLLFVRGLHINSSDYGILSNFLQANYSDNLFYQQGSSYGLILDPAANDVIVRGNIFFGSGTSTGIVVGNSPRRVSIVGNHFNNQQTGIWLQPGATQNYIAQNVFVNTNSKVLDQGTGNTVFGWGASPP